MGQGTPLAESSRTRTTFLGAIAVAIALVIAYLGDCLGLQSGGTGAAVDAAVQTEGQTPPKPDAGQPTTVVATTIVVTGDKCQSGDGPAGSCEALCKSLSQGVSVVQIDGGTGAHGVVEQLRTCLKAADVDVRMVSP